MDSTAKQKDLAFLKALKDLGFEATSKEIRLRTESDAEIVNLDNGHISHRRNKRFRGDQNSKPLNNCLFTEEPQSQSGRKSEPMVIRVKEDQREDVARFIEESLADGTVGMFGSPEEAFEDLMTTIDEQKASIDELESRIDAQEQTVEQLTEDFATAIARIRAVMIEQHSIDIRDTIDESEEIVK
jgi:uncharacterized coiled-coil protein SlyX